MFKRKGAKPEVKALNPIVEVALAVAIVSNKVDVDRMSNGQLLNAIFEELTKVEKTDE